MEKGKGAVIFAALNAKYIHSSLSVWYLAAAMRESAPELGCVVYEATVNEPSEKIITEITAHDIFAVCFSCYIWNIEKTLEIAAEIKARSPEIYIILGGPEAEHNAKALLLNNRFLSAVSLGEGEESLPQVLKALYLCADNNGGNVAHALSDKNGIAYISDNDFLKNPPIPLSKAPPSPYTSEYLSQLEKRMAYIETSRGCPYSCAFCLSGAMFAPKWFSLERAKKDILTLANSGAKTIKFIDRTFNAKSSHANEIWRFIAESYGKEIPCSVRFHFEIAADILSNESMEILKSLPRGAVQLEAGIQSINEQTLTAVRRKTNTAVLLNKLKALIAFDNMHIHIDLIAGLPHEDLNSFINGFNRVYLLKSNMLQLGFLKLLHGSAMRNEAREYPCVYSALPPYEVINTPWLKQEDIALLRNVEDALERLYNSQRFLLTLDYVIESSGLTPFEVLRCVPYAAHKTPLEEYTRLVLSSFSSLPNINEGVLRDKMAQDWLSFNSTGRLPPSLCIADDALKKAVKALAKNPTTAPLPHIKRGVAILYSESAVAYVDYNAPDALSKRYPLNIVKGLI